MVDSARPCLAASELQLARRIAAAQFSLSEGECVVLCGPNGSGKSSLLRLLGGLESPDSGQVSLNGSPLEKLSRRQIAAQIAWLPQRPRLIESITCEAIVAAARFRFSEPTARAEQHAIRVLEEQGIGHLIGRFAQQVSGGELQRVLIASLIAQDVPFLLVDEPANHLDPSHQLSTYRRLGELWQSGKGMIIVSHDVRLARLLGPPEKVRVIFINEGQVSLETRLDSPQLARDLSQLYGVPFVPQGQPQALTVQLP